MKSALATYTLHIADNCLVLGHRLSEWCGHSPAVEEDLAMANIALDLIGQAQTWLTLAADIKGGDTSADQLAYQRDTHEFRNLLLVEQPNGDYATTMARQLYFDYWHYLLLQSLCDSKEPRIAEIAAKAIKEVRYHTERSQYWTLCLGNGTKESHEKMQAAVNDLWMYTGELFENDATDDEMIKKGVGVSLRELHSPWLKYIKDVLTQATLKIPEEDAWMQQGGKAGRHSEHMGYILAEMQFLQRAYPDARW